MTSLDERITALRSELSVYSKDIITHVSALYSKDKENGRFDLKNDPFNVLKILKHDVSDVLEQSKEQSDVLKTNAKEMEDCSRMVDVLDRVSSISDKLMICEESISKLHLCKACKVIAELEDLLRGLPSPNTEIGSGQICSILRKEWKILKSRLISKSKRLMQDSIKFEYGRITVNRQLKGMVRAEDVILEDPILLSEIWETIVELNEVDDIVDELLRKIWIYILRPLWKEKKSQSVHTPTSTSRSELIFESIARGQGQSKTSEEDSRHNASEAYYYLQPNSPNPYASSTFGPCRMALGPLITHVGQVFTFVSTEMLCDNDKVVDCLALKLNTKPVMLASLISDAIAFQLPRREADLAAFRSSLQESCCELEDKFATYGFFVNVTQQEDGDNDVSEVCRPLTQYLNDLPSKYVQIRRQEILERAREVVLADYHNTMLATGDAAEDELSSAGDIGNPKALLEQSGSFAIQKLRFDSCQVSLASCRLLKLLHEVLQQAPGSSLKVANVLFQAARDCLELFMAIVPMRFSDVIDTVPRMGAVFYNDCLYIAHNCILISHKYRQELGQVDSVLLSTAGLADYIPRFRAQGDACLLRHLEEQKSALSELVSRIHLTPEGGSDSSDLNEHGETVYRPGMLLQGGLQLAGAISQGSKAIVGGVGVGVGIGASALKELSATMLNDEESAGQVVRHMERLSGQWLGVLQEPVYTRLLGHLLEGVLVEAMRSLLTAECIAEDAAVDITRVFRTLQRTRSMFPEDQRDDEALGKVCPSWKKFLALTDLLEFNLSEVAEWLPRKKFSSFSGPEMTCLIKALFEDSTRRQSILMNILEMSS